MRAEGPIPQLLASGLTTGAIYALVGLGLTLVYTTTRVINVAIGDFAAIGALVAASLASAGLGLPLAIPVAVATGGVVGAAMFWLVVRPAQRRGASVLTLLIVTIAVHLVLVAAPRSSGARSPTACRRSARDRPSTSCRQSFPASRCGSSPRQH
jgi:branched-chain amino acid transport system permease protein